MTERRAGTAKCGWCLTGHHESCRGETTPFFGKTWTCPCDCEKGTKTPTFVSRVSEVKPATKVAKADSKKAARVRKVAEKELEKVLASDEIQSGVKEAL